MQHAGHLGELDTGFFGATSRRLSHELTQVGVPVSERDVREAAIAFIIVSGAMFGGTVITLTSVAGVNVLRNFVATSNPVALASGDQDTQDSAPAPKIAYAVATSTPTPTIETPTKAVNAKPATVTPTPKDVPLPSGEKAIIPKIVIDAGPQTLNLNCEATGAASIARAAGYKDITADKLMALLVEMDDGNPYDGFVGNPNGKPGSVGSDGYGVYPSAIAAALAKMGVKAEAGEGRGLDYIHSQLALGRPVLTINVWGLPDTAPTVTWLSKDKARVVGVPFEHSLVITGESGNYYLVYNSKPTKDHPMYEWVLKTQFKKTFDLMGGQTLVIPPKAK